MSFYNKYIHALFVTTRFYILLGICVGLYLLAFVIPVLYSIVNIFFVLVCALILFDYVFLFNKSLPLYAVRTLSNRLSNGEENLVTIEVKNNCNFWLHLTVIDELPAQLQERNFELKASLESKATHIFKYTINPKQRGLFQFGQVIIFLQSKLGLVQRKVILANSESTSVYPAFSQLGKYALLTKTYTNDYGSTRMRKLGHSMEFEQIKEYVTGDDVRAINWKATARKGALMINNFSDEKSQQVYCVIDKGRLMKMPFNGLSLLDYAINATLALTSTCLQKQDKIGLISFAEKMGTIIAADKKPIQREKISQFLYKENTTFLESDFEMLYMQVRNKIKQRSLIILFTNFESSNGLKRKLNYLRSIAKHHLLLVVFFENTELNKLSHAKANTVADVYVKTIAEKFAYEKRMLVKELQQYGIVALQTSPEGLTVNIINKYLELKQKQML
jgi:uncharacterized protein (DUF58 family)